MDLLSRVAGEGGLANIQGNSGIREAVNSVHTMAMKSTKRLRYIFQLCKFQYRYMYICIYSLVAI